MAQQRSNPAQRYFLVPYHAYEEGSYVGMQAAIIRGRNVDKVIHAVDMETKEGSFPPELVAAMESDTFGGSSVERAGDGFYYVSGYPEDEDDSETPLYVINYGSADRVESYDTLGDAEEAAQHQYKVYSPVLYSYDERGGLRELKKGSKRHNPTRSKDTMARSTNPKGKHIACGTDITKKECRQLQHVYESARSRGYSPERAAKQAWGSLDNPRRGELMNWGNERARRATNGAGLGGFLGSLVGVVIGLPFGQPLVSVLLSTLGGATGARYAAQSDRKERATVGGGVGGVFGPIFAALGGYLAGRKPDKRARNPDEGLALPKPRATATKRKKNPGAAKAKAPKRKSNPGRGPSSGVNAGALAQRLANGG